MRHATTILTKCFNWYFNRNCNFNNFSKVLICAPWRWSSGTETFRGYVKHLNTNCSISCFNKQCIRWRIQFIQSHIPFLHSTILSFSKLDISSFLFLRNQFFFISTTLITCNLRNCQDFCIAGSNTSHVDVVTATSPPDVSWTSANMRLRHINERASTDICRLKFGTTKNIPMGGPMWKCTQQL
jgi:hypothetical protein